MAYTRDDKDSSSGGLQGKIMLLSTGEYEWVLIEWYKSAEIVGKTGAFSGKTTLKKGTEVDYDTAAAALKTAFVAAR
tara:strand:- start:238 stop:468 length:231 start_codon:yes stop_codon:yes gene_type:complete